MSKYLVGKTITQIKIADDKKAILFITDCGDVIARTDGDCCSDSWIEHIGLPALGFPAKVIDVCDLDYGPENNYLVVQGYTVPGARLKHYGCKITTDRGEIFIDYRNESNGYYYGDLCWPDEGFYGGVQGQNVSTEQWVEVDGDV